MWKVLKYDAGKDYKDQLDCSCEKRKSVKRVKEDVLYKEPTRCNFGSIVY